ncbi:Ig-like domain-containing protein [Nonomuraea solani]|uniref:Ig-like domain-containing protein n=1 Tax=Nonomuraea solani TaxID=1144553 RepID=A0A1H5VF12_9ACTN|nr:NBR1-Ig-like domain-containing protein [Nonomuraea solani]SEF85636.1 Ig-like domain-containing protein [Nonomuraea solani]
MAESSESQDEGLGSRRGRKPIRPNPESGPVALFAHRLWELKAQAGDPSFADMASRMGAAASKSSLAAAARGSALPSWETTWEFVRVLAVDRLGRDADEVRREWRAYWEQAAATENEAGMPETAGQTPEPPTRPSDPSNPSADTTTGPTTGSPTGSSGRRLTLLAAVTGVAGLAAVLLGWVMPLVMENAKSTPTNQPTPAQPSAPRDDSAFEGDVTFPDGSVVKKGAEFDKVWRIRNAGNVPWQGRYLTRMNDTPCKAPKRVGIGPVLPGETVDITVRVRASDKPGRCKIFWKMTDEDGSPLLAAKKPIFLDVTVA